MHARLSLQALAFWLTASAFCLGAETSGKEEIEVAREIRYREGSSKAWRLDLAMKKDLRGKPRPGIVVIHGGGWLEGDKSSFVFKDRNAPANIVDFAKLGFVAVTINYRLSAEAPFPAALEDCKCAVRWLRAHAREYNLDRETSVLMGIRRADTWQCCLRWSARRRASRGTAHIRNSRVLSRPPSATAVQST